MSSDEFSRQLESILENPAIPESRRAFEVACKFDSLGRPDLAVDGYRTALDQGLESYESRRARIQLASSLRNLGHLEEGLKVLSNETDPLGDGLDDAVVLFRALLLTDLGYEREAVATLVHALASHLPRYVNSAHRYADLLLETAPRQAKLQHTDEVEK
ncbi:tetratricopeptide repeat protein [Dermatophilus congolensis]|nr:tetratricopeptide repeat protein [Dermatophilus congolensis]MBO3129579.1 tetratricopeptide repeat protein [Dermatophilus congolensis]MBO3131788.1 tetratricopeptide repeat protein [Dermatophilus congolensis]MBO3134054.1 tetratricopeptide repeat protein [Dermatophilus congolensis]MBO3136287.1 tetratricopeptide repeat protein [Dermatophilus congolensis]MBO3138535.1 tetratricopeptide repeat protein [Dermatophilus congolensis]